MELPIGNRCRYYFNGSTIVSNAPSVEFTDSRNVFGCKAGYVDDTSFELYEGIIINNGGTYCIHDENAYCSNSILHKYVNMVIRYNKSDVSPNGAKCIGGGANKDGFIVIDNCLFITDFPAIDVDNQILFYVEEGYLSQNPSYDEIIEKVRHDML